MMVPKELGLQRQTKRRFTIAIALLIVLLLRKSIMYTIGVLTFQEGANAAIYPQYTMEVMQQKVTSFNINFSLSSPSPNSYAYTTPNPAFLLFFAHSGYSNQVIALQRAAQLAYKLNRTLVVSPVLPHKGDAADLFPSWNSASYVSICYALRHHEVIQNWTLGQARLAKETKGPLARFPSFHSIMDFGALQNSTGLQVLDLDEFMQQEHKRSTPKKSLSFFKSYNASIYSFCNANIDHNVTNHVSNHQCQINSPRNYAELVDHIQQQMAKQHGSQEWDEDKQYARDCRVVNIGSGFVLSNNFAKDPMAPAFNAFFSNQPLVEPWNRILKMLLKERCSNNIIGVHVRTLDDKTACEDNTALYDNAAEQVLQRIANRESTATSKKNTKNKIPSKHLVIIGRANRNSKVCLKQALTKAISTIQNKGISINITMTNSSSNTNTLPSIPAVLTVNDLIDQHEDKKQLEKWIDSIPLEVSTRYLILDQLVLAMASELVMQKAYAFGSTFQLLIVNRQKYLKENIKALGLTEC
ncbi:hypothetical protein IV203_032742 [Nitzschia inconspicua]|uniref:GDP-fucose protein O-fucosyltransferase n=1 Tax=Nitzschia inconspicua TaxID=303405 RepID=A0A9K3KKX0_9STRA|nr:hypothetical protein IV203_032742 [Nitzschia inconspicua]